MLDRSIHIREALFHTIPFSEVKDMKSNILWALKASFFLKTLNLICGLSFNNLQERKIA
jgi:hypothetical protein